jgi:hypothetical protein
VFPMAALKYRLDFLSAVICHKLCYT